MTTTRMMGRSSKLTAQLGVLSLVVNLLSVFLLPAVVPCWLGVFFLVIGASTLGMAQGLLIAAIGVLPITLLHGEHLQGIRLLMLAGTIGALAESRVKLPPFLTTALLWATVFGPLLMFAPEALHLPFPTRVAVSLSTALGETFLSLLAGVALMSPYSWGWLTGKPRHFSLLEIVINGVVGVALLAVMVVLSTTSTVSGAYLVLAPEMSASQAYLTMALAIFAPTAAAGALSYILVRFSQELAPAGLLHGTRSPGFSGLASDFWRRKSSSEIARAEEALAARTSTVAMPRDGHQGNGVGRAESLNKERSTSVFTPDRGICALNRNGTIIFINNKFRELTGLRKNDVVGQMIDGVGLEPAFSREIVAQLKRSVSKGTRFSELKLNELPNKLRFFEIAVMRADEVESSTLSDGPDSIIIGVRDITDRRTVESHLLQAQKLDSLGRLVQGIAHAFNNALTTISGQASIAQSSSDPETMQKTLAQIVSSSKEAGTLVRQLLEFAEGNPALLSREDLGKVIEDCLLLVKQMVGESCEIVFDKPSKPVPVTCEPHLLMQAITNLVMNSQEALSNRSGHVSIALESEQLDETVSDFYPGARPGSYARLRIKDNGAGMTPEVLAKAFDPLFTTKGREGHAGLGLSIVFAIVRAHDGFLTVESKPEKGTSFSIYIPMAPSETVSASGSSNGSLGHSSADGAPSLSTAPSPTRSAHATTGATKILVVEDQAELRDLISMMLSSLGYKVAACGSGIDALATCQETSFDLVLADVIMPRMPGPELLKRLREQGCSAKTLLMTGYAVSGESAQTLAKPFDLEMLAHAVREALDGSSQDPAQESPEQSSGAHTF